jgi:hypothetical protein
MSYGGSRVGERTTKDKREEKGKEKKNTNKLDGFISQKIISF